MSSLEAVKASLRPTAWLDVVKVVPRSIVPSSDQTFWDCFEPHFARLLRHKRHRGMKFVSDVFPGLKFNDFLFDFGIKIEPSEDAT